MGKANRNSKLKGLADKPANDDLERKLLAAGQFGSVKLLRSLSSEPGNELIELLRSLSSKPGVESKPKPKPKPTRKGRPMTRLLPMLRELFPPDGIPSDRVKTVTVMQRVLKVYEARGWGEVSRSTVERAIGRRED